MIIIDNYMLYIWITIKMSPFFIVEIHAMVTKPFRKTVYSYFDICICELLQDNKQE